MNANTEGVTSAAGASTVRAVPDYLAGADEAVRRRLNALAVTSNIVSALIRFPGPASDHDQAVAAARAMVQSAQKTTAGLIGDLGIGEEGWKRFLVMRMVSEAVASHWRATASQGTPSADVEHMRAVWLELSQFDLPVDASEPEMADPAIALRIAVLDAMSPVIREIGVFSLFHEPGAAAKHARDIILAAAEDVKARLCGDRASPPSAAQLLTSLLRNAGAIYAAAWRRHQEAIVDELYSAPAEERATRIASHPGGFPLDQIDRAFREAFGRLCEMVEHLAPTSDVAPGSDSNRNRDRAPGETGAV